MTQTEEAPVQWMPKMADPNEPATKTVRVAAEAVRQLQTIAALKEEMGERFKAIEFLNALIEGPIKDLHTETTAAYAEFQAKRKRRKPGSGETKS